MMYHRIRALATDFDVDLIAFFEDDGDTFSTEGLQEYCRSISLHKVGPWEKALGMVSALASGAPMQCYYYHSPTVSRLIAEMLRKERYDLVYLGTIRLTSYLPLFREHRVVLDFIDSMTLNLERKIGSSALRSVLFGYELARIRRLESVISRQVNLGFVVSLVDKSKLGGDNIVVVPLGVDLTPVAMAEERGKEPFSIVFVGSMFYEPNVTAVHYFVDNVFGRVLARVPKARFYVVGNRPSRSIRRLGERHRSIVVTGFVDSVFDYLLKCQVAVCPMRSGSGMQNKILESMGSALPVVTTSIGKGDIRAPHDALLVVDDPRKMADAVSDLLEDPGRCQKIGLRAQEFVRQTYPWSGAYETVLTSVRGILDGGAPLERQGGSDPGA